MNWIVQTIFQSSIGRKVIMALTGLFLCSFLIVHLLGNLQLLKSDGGEAFNKYAEFMSTFPVVRVLSWGNFAMILLHIIDAVLLTSGNRQARPVNYNYSNPSANSSWASRNMGLLGSIILVFLVVHLGNFWFKMHFGSVPFANYNGAEVKDLYTVVKASFAQPLYVAIYVLAQAALGYHLAHGFSSAFQSLGLSHIKYNSFIRNLGFIFAIAVPAAYAIIPVYMYIMQQ